VVSGTEQVRTSTTTFCWAPSACWQASGLPSPREMPLAR
jgi:hypothetical protein